MTTKRERVIKILNKKQNESYIDLEIDFQMNHFGEKLEEYTDGIEDLLTENDIYFLKRKEVHYSPLENEKVILKNPYNKTQILTIRKEDNKLFLYFINEAKMDQKFFDFGKFFSSKKIKEINNKKDIEDVKKAFQEYIEEYEKYLDIEFFGEFKKNDTKVSINKQGKKFFVVLKDDEHKVIGSRYMDFSPFETYLKTGLFTICGGSDIKEKYIGKGYGLLMYNTIDKVIPYQQIPHGYAGAPHQLSSYSTNFWKKRQQYREIPPILKEYDNKDIDMENQFKYGHYYLSILDGYQYKNDILQDFLKEYDIKRECSLRQDETGNCDDFLYISNNFLIPSDKIKNEMISLTEERTLNILKNIVIRLSEKNINEIKENISTDLFNKIKPEVKKEKMLNLDEIFAELEDMVPSKM